jgi:radical SAM superfamily enzyme YgiQ (UPF0313 family)
MNMRVGNLSEPGAVLLVSCYELGHQPMGLAWPAAFLSRAGFQPVCLDTSVEGLAPEPIRAARFVAISAPMHTAVRLGFLAAGHIREWNPDCRICFFGLYAWLNAEYLLGRFADYVIGGEYEEPLVRLLQALQEGNAENVEGVFRRGMKSRPFLERLSFPVPNRDGLVPLEEYAGLERFGTRTVAGYVEASRGCLHTCLHCPITPVYRGRFFIVPRDIVLQDVRRQWASGARHITFGDPDFLNGPKHSLQIAKALHQEFPELTFDFTAKVEHLVRYRALLHEFALCGCLFVVSAVESFSDEVLANLEKGHTRADIFDAIRFVREAGIVLRPSLVAFTPWTTLSDYVGMLDTIEKEGLADCIDPVQYAVRLLLPPGSPLLSHPSMQRSLGRLNESQFAYDWAHPDPRMDRLHREVSVLVERAAVEGEGPSHTFLRIRESAYRTFGEPVPRRASIPTPGYASVHLTEPWFC